MPDKTTMVVLINVFTVEPAHQERLVGLLAHATDGSINQRRASFLLRSIAASTAQK